MSEREVVQSESQEREIEALRERVAELTRAAREHETTADALRISEEVFRQIFEDGPIGMHLVTPTFHLLKVNEALCRMLGYTAKELVGRPFADIVHEDDRPKGQALARQMRSGERDGFRIQRRYIKKNGDVIWTSVSATVIRDKNDEALYGIGVVENITDQKRADEEKQELEEQLRQSQKMEAIGRLAGGIAHDFNNLLTVILGNAGLLQASSENAPRRVEEIIEASERAASLTRQLLTFTRKDVSTTRVLDPNQIVSDMETMLRRLIGEHIALDVTLDPGAGRIRADASQIEQVILNLALNARDAMPDGGHLYISTAAMVLPSEPRLRKGGRSVLLTFRDDGRGMSSETLERAYEPFFTTKPTGRGTGLGLATVYAIVTQAEGHIDVESTLGAGTTVRAYFPATEEHGNSSEAESTAAEYRGEEVILVREDDEPVRTVTCQILRTAGYEVLEADSASTAIELLATSARPVALLVCDVVMPDMNGRDLARLLTQEHPTMEVLFISGYTSQILDSQGVHQESLEFLQKPFAPMDLTRRVREILDAKPLDRAPQT